MRPGRRPRAASRSSCSATDRGPFRLAQLWAKLHPRCRRGWEVLPDAGLSDLLPRVRWSATRLIVLGAILGFAPTVLDASLSLNSTLAFLDGRVSGLPFWLVALNAALVGLLVPAGLFLLLCGILLAVRSFRPPGFSRAFRAGIGGAGVNLAAGLILGMVNLVGYLVPLEMMTVDFIRTEVVVAFVAAVAAALGLFLASLGIALLLKGEPFARAQGRTLRVRLRRGKSIYRRVPSAR